MYQPINDKVLPNYKYRGCLKNAKVQTKVFLQNALSKRRSANMQQRVFSCKFAAYLQNIFLLEHHCMAASALWKNFSIS